MHHSDLTPPPPPSITLLEIHAPLPSCCAPAPTHQPCRSRFQPLHTTSIFRALSHRNCFITPAHACARYHCITPAHACARDRCIKLARDLPPARLSTTTSPYPCLRLPAYRRHLLVTRFVPSLAASIHLTSGSLRSRRPLSFVASTHGALTTAGAQTSVALPHPFPVASEFLGNASYGRDRSPCSLGLCVISPPRRSQPAATPL